jgi:hypothetical protein
MNYRNTYTRNPRAYVTGGMAQRSAAGMLYRTECFDGETLPEPLDAPDRIPTGGSVQSHGVWFMELAPRDGA